MKKEGFIATHVVALYLNGNSVSFVCVDTWVASKPTITYAVRHYWKLLTSDGTNSSLRYVLCVTSGKLVDCFLTALVGSPATNEYCLPD